MGGHLAGKGGGERTGVLHLLGREAVRGLSGRRGRMLGGGDGGAWLRVVEGWSGSLEE